MRRVRSESAFTLIELMVVVAIAAILASLGIQEYELFTAKAKRSEAYAGLSALYAAQTEYFASHNEYAASFDALGFSIDGGRRISATEIRGNRYVYQLSRPWGRDSYYAVAFGNVDSDPWPDVMVSEVGRR